MADDLSPLTWHNERRRVSDLIPNPINPRVLTQKKAADLKASLKRFNYVEPVAINPDGSLIGGHQRIKIMLAAKMVKPSDEIDVRVPSRPLTDDETNELLVRLNLNTGDWDDDMLANHFDQEQLLDWGFEPTYFQTDDPRLGADMPEEKSDPIEVFDDKIRVKKGETWLIGTNGSRIICGDSGDPEVVSHVMGHDKIDFVFTSPPYNVSIDYNEHKDSEPLVDYVQWLAKIVAAFMPHLPQGRAIGWNIGTSPKTSPHRQFCMLEDAGLSYLRLLVWKKVGIPLPNFQHTRNDPRARRLTPHYQHEVVGLFSLGELEYGNPVQFDETLQADVFEIMQAQATADIPKEGKKTTRRHGGLARHSLKVHPAVFPTRLPGAFIQHMADVGAVVFDPFMGSGTTLLAAEALGRIGIGVEVDPRYVEVSLQRAERLGLIVTRVQE